MSEANSIILRIKGENCSRCSNKTCLRSLALPVNCASEGKNNCYPCFNHKCVYSWFSVAVCVVEEVKYTVLASMCDTTQTTKGGLGTKESNFMCKGAECIAD